MNLNPIAIHNAPMSIVPSHRIIIFLRTYVWKDRKRHEKNPRRAKPRLRRVRFTKSQRVDRRSTYRKHLASMRTNNTIVVNQCIAQNHSRPVQPQGETMRTTTHQAATSVIADSNPVIRQWLKYKQTKFYRIWSKRPSFSYGSYTVIFLGMVVLGRCSYGGACSLTSNIHLRTARSYSR